VQVNLARHLLIILHEQQLPAIQGIHNSGSSGHNAKQISGLNNAPVGILCHPTQAQSHPPLVLKQAAAGIGLVRLCLKP